VTNDRAGWTAHELVPLADRLRYLRFLRLAVVAVVAIVAGFDSGGIAPASAPIWAATGAYVGAFGVGELAWRVARRRGLWLYSVLLMIDATYLVYVDRVTGGLSSPLRFLILMHLVAVALLASYRTGLKLVFWYVLLLALDFQLPHAFGGNNAAFAHAPGSAYARLMFFALTLASVTLATSALSAVNERELRRRRFDLEALATLGAQLEHATEPAVVASTAVASIADNFEIGRLALIATGPSPYVLAGEGLTALDVEPVHVSAVIEHATQLRTTLLPATLDPDDDPWLNALFDGARNLVVAPLSAEGGCLGVLVFEHGARRGSRIERRLLTIIERFASHTALALRNAILLEKVQQAASTDALTGIANRRSFEEALDREIARSVRTGEPVSLVMIDLDHFKSLNDTYGHQMGDEVLREVAQLLREQCREMDIAARYGGEEFTVIMPSCAAEEAITSATRLWNSVGSRAHATVPLTVSAGVATFPDHARTGQDLIFAADQALYDAKGAGRDQVAGCRESLPRTRLGIVAGRGN
jgi:two-component system, cell cycle response regulator